jgi:hypothetical protein
VATLQNEKKGKKNHFAAKWTWMDEDKPKGVKGRSGFADLNPKVFIVVAKMQR